MAKKPLSGRERDRLARMKGASAKKVAPKRSSPAPAAKKLETKAPEPKPEPVKETPKAEIKPSPTPVATPIATPEEKEKVESQAKEKPVVAPPKKEATPTKENEKKDEIKPAPKTFSAIQKEGAAASASKMSADKELTKSSVMAEQTENQNEHSDSGDNGRDSSQLVENVSTKPLRYSLLAALALALVVFWSQKFGPSHDHGHSEASKTEEAKPMESNEEAMPVMEDAGAPAEEAVTPTEEEAAPEAEESESSEEATSYVSTEEAATPAPSKFEKPFWGYATEAVASESLAKSRVKGLKAKGYDANYIYILDYIPGGLKLYRVFIGPFKDESSLRSGVASYDQSDAYIFSVQ